ncbi:PhzF family phenazine biosynthesis protein [Caldimonas brevitalea]|uniref:Phenazine biosynthesis protein PhzF n=1 Tax=Caldimonas brevitalea TaxID=413882 RepID=A0A0G3BWE7_9BURK|nr:PhzF family phenazine biosynthesis protein [Caldimonas brevitalea]AKJ31721.1 phenazine biosynthesis protein PhzF [Caldimonas brevitalea]
MKRAFKQVDVFSGAALRGNPLAVVFSAEGLSDEQMAEFARWTNLSETTFLLPPTDPAADYRVRIFTPSEELPFAGHPTLGSCHAWLEAGGRPRTPGQVVQQCAVGLVTLRREDDSGRLAFAAPPLRMREVEPGLLADVCAALGVTVQQVEAARWLDNGPTWLGLRLASAEAVLALEPRHGALVALAKVGVIGPWGPGAPCQFEVRAFAEPVGVPEDPVTGSLNASLAQWLIGEGVAPERYVAAQGTRLGRAGRVHIVREGDTVWVGGESRTCIDGSLSL